MVKSRQKNRCDDCKAGLVSVDMATCERESFCHVCGLPSQYKMSGDLRRTLPLRIVYFLPGMPRLRGQWEIGRNRLGAAGRPKQSGAPQKPPRSLLEPGSFGASWHLVSFNAGGHLTRGNLDGSWYLSHGMLFHKNRLRQKRTDSDSEIELGTESEQWIEHMQDDVDAFLDAALEDPALMKRLFPVLWRQRIADDGDAKEMALQDPGDLIESMDEEDLKDMYYDVWKRFYGKKKTESDDYWDNKKEIDANSR